jgi:hypothetical protein
MGFKTVFMTVGAGQDDAEIDRAVTICEGLGAHLSLLVLGIAPPPPASPYGVVSNDIWAGDIRQGQDEAGERAKAIEERLAGTSISSLVTAQYIDRGTVATLAARFARYADLTLVTPKAAGYESMQSWGMDGALFESGRPILMLPPGPASFPRSKRVMICWDASVEASKAVRDGIGLRNDAYAVQDEHLHPGPTFD